MRRTATSDWWETDEIDEIPIIEFQPRDKWSVSFDEIKALAVSTQTAQFTATQNMGFYGKSPAQKAAQFGAAYGMSGSKIYKNVYQGTYVKDDVKAVLDSYQQFFEAVKDDDEPT